MKESKALLYVTRRNVQIDLDREYSLYNSEITRDRRPTLQGLRYEKTQDVGSQYDYKKDNRDNLSCTCRNISSLRRRRDIRYFSSPKQVYAYHERSRSFTDVGIGSVKALLKKKVQRIYLPETDDRGCGSSELSWYLQKARQHKANSYYESKRTSSKCVGGILACNPGHVMSEKLSPIIQTVSESTSPQVSENRNIEIGSNTINKIVINTTTQVEQLIDKEVDSSIEDKEDTKAEYSQEEKVRINIINSTEVRNPNTMKDKKYKPLEKFSSDSLVQHVHDLENPSDDVEKQSRCSEDLMENKLEREYRKIFTTKSKDSKKSSLPDNKSASILKRRFEALRRGLARKDDSKKNSLITPKVSSQVSVIATSHKDVSINSDPPSLEARSFSNTKMYSPHAFASIVEHDKSNIYNPQPSYKRTANRPQRASVSWSKTDEDDSECNGVKGMFKLWGKKFNFEEDADKQNPMSPTFDIDKQTSEKKNMMAKMATKANVEDKEKRKFFFFKKKNKEEKKEKPYTKPKKDVMAGRCEVKEGLMIKIGTAEQPYKSETKKKTPEMKRKVYDEETGQAAWLQRYLSQAIESRNSVKVRWNNKMYGTSSSTVFELMDTVYRDTGIVFRSRSEVTVTSSYYKPYSRRQHVNYAQQNIEAWMIPKTVTDHPQKLPGKIKRELNLPKNENMEVRISDQKWFIDKSKAFSHKIEVVLLSKNLVRCHKKESSEYLRIDIPKGFFLNSSDTSDDNRNNKQNQSSDEEVYKIVEYETGSDLKKERNYYRSDKEQSNVKVSLSVKSHRNFEPNILETVIKTPPVHRDVVIQDSKVYIPKKCDVVGVGIITQREMRDSGKPILTIHGDLSDNDSEHELRLHLKKCEFAESYLQEYYRHWAPSTGIDLFSWCVSDSHLRCCSEPSKTSYYNQGDCTKSCPNIFEDYQAIVSSCETSQLSCRRSCYVDDEPHIVPAPRWYQKIGMLDCCKSKDKDQPDLRRALPKDSIEVFKRRKMYAASMKSCWRTGSNEGPCSVPSTECKSAGLDCRSPKMGECPVVRKPCWKPSKLKKTSGTCQPCQSKHVSLPNCEEMQEMLKGPVTDPEGILAFKGAEKCDKKDRCKVDPAPVCVIPTPACQSECEKMKKPYCRDSKVPCDELAKAKLCRAARPPCGVLPPCGDPDPCATSPPCATPPPCLTPKPPCMPPCLSPPKPKPPCEPPPKPPCEPPPRPPCEPPPNLPCEPPPRPPCDPPPKPPCEPPPKPPCESPPKPPCEPPPKPPCEPPPKPPYEPPPKPPSESPRKPPCSPPSKPPCSPPSKPPCSPPAKQLKAPCSPPASPPPCSPQPPKCPRPKRSSSKPRPPCTPPPICPPSPPVCPSPPPPPPCQNPSRPPKPPCQKPPPPCQKPPPPPPCQKPPPPCQKPPPPCPKPPPPCQKPPPPCQKPPPPRHKPPPPSPKAPPCQKSPPPCCALPCPCPISPCPSTPTICPPSPPPCPPTPPSCPSTPPSCPSTPPPYPPVVCPHDPPCFPPPCQKPPPCKRKSPRSPKCGTPPKSPKSRRSKQKCKPSPKCAPSPPVCPNAPPICKCSHRKCSLSPLSCPNSPPSCGMSPCCVRDPLRCPVSPPPCKKKKKKKRSCSSSSSGTRLIPNFLKRGSSGTPPCAPPPCAIPQPCSPTYSMVSEVYSYSSGNEDEDPAAYQYSAVQHSASDYCGHERGKHKRVREPPSTDTINNEQASLVMHPCTQCRPSYEEFPWPTEGQHTYKESTSAYYPEVAVNKCSNSCLHIHKKSKRGTVLTTAAAKQYEKKTKCPNHPSNMLPPCAQKLSRQSTTKSPSLPSPSPPSQSPPSPSPPSQSPPSPSPPSQSPPSPSPPSQSPPSPSPPSQSPPSPSPPSPSTPKTLPSGACCPPKTPPKRRSPPRTPPPSKRVPLCATPVALCSPAPCTKPPSPSETSPPQRSPPEPTPPEAYYPGSCPIGIPCPVTGEGGSGTKSKPKLTGVHLRISPSRKASSPSATNCDPECQGPRDNKTNGDDACFNLSSEDKITIRLKKETPSTEEIREGLNIKVQDEDGRTLYERKDYVKNSSNVCEMPKSSVLGDVYKNSYVQRMATPLTCETDSNKDILDDRSNTSIANTIEIQFKVKVTQGDKSTEINIANDDKSDIVMKDRKRGKPPQDVFVLKDEGARSEDKSDGKNDINIRIVIKNFKPKSSKKAYAKQGEYSKEFAKQISAKFHSVSTGYSDMMQKNVDHVYSIHRATVDLTSSVEKSRTHSRHSEGSMSEPVTEQETDKIVVSSRVTEESICVCMAGDVPPMIEPKIVDSNKSSKRHVAYHNTQEDSDLENPETDIEKTDTDKPETDYERPETDYEKPETDYEKPETDTEKPEIDAEKPETKTEKFETYKEKLQLDAGKSVPYIAKEGTGDTHKPEIDNKIRETDPEKPATYVEKQKSDTNRPETDTEKPETDLDNQETDEERQDSDAVRPETDVERSETDIERPDTDSERSKTNREKPDIVVQQLDVDTDKAETDTDKAETDAEKPETDIEKLETDSEKTDTDTEKPEAAVAKPKNEVENLDADAEKLDVEAGKPETDVNKPETDAEKPETDTDKLGTDTEKLSERKFKSIVSTDTDDNERYEEENTGSLEIIKKPRTKDEKKAIMKTVFEKARDVKKNKFRMKKLRDMLKVILTSDSSEPDNLKASNKTLAKDVTYASLQPNYFRDSDSTNNYYTVEKNITVSDRELKTVAYTPDDFNSECSKSSYVTSDNDTPPAAGCMCNAVAERLKMASRMGNGGGGCCCSKPRSRIKKSQEICCDIKQDSSQSYSPSDEKETDYVNVQTQNSRYLESKFTSTDMLVENAIRSSLRMPIDLQKQSKKDSILRNPEVSSKYLEPFKRSFSPHMTHVRECGMRKLNRNTILSISGEDKIVVLSAKPTRISSEVSKSKEYKKKMKSGEKHLIESADILQSYETKKAVLEIYTERDVSNKGERLVAKLPKFVYDTESEIYNAISTNSYVYKNNVVMMTINR